MPTGDRLTIDLTNTRLAEFFAPWHVLHYHDPLRLMSLNAFGWFPWLFAVPPFAVIDIWVVDGDKRVSMRMDFWLWLRTMATWVDLFNLTSALDSHTQRVGKRKPRSSHRLRQGPEPKQQTKLLPGTAGLSPAADQHGIVSKVEADSIRRQLGKRGTPDLLIDPAAISENAMSGLIEEWIVPTVVERLIRILLADQAKAREG
jgi:hypothetical protein